MTEENEWLTVAKAAALFGGVTPATMRKVIRDEGVSVLRVSNDIRIRREDFDKLFEAHFKPLNEL
jgi:hypothetical protein